MEVYASTKYAVEGLTDGLRRSLLPWGITVMRVHPSSVTGTEFTKHMRRGGTVKYMPVPIGRIKRERLARRIVELMEKPQRALFISRVYDVPVLLNKLFPGVMDRLSAGWVRQKRKKEITPLEQITPVEYQPARNMIPVWLAAGSIGLMAIFFRLLTSKTFRRLPRKRRA
jgi:hypothetical protein